MVHQWCANLRRDASTIEESMNSKSRQTVRTSVILPEDARAQIEALATANDVSAAWVMRHAILKFLDEYAGQRELPLRLPAARRSSAA